WQRVRGGPEQDEYRDQILHTLEMMGVRRREQSFDGRELFNYPANPRALDLLIIQKPDMTVSEVMSITGIKLDIPIEHITAVVKGFQDLKKREQPFPIHPFLLEIAKEIPHFALMGLGAVIWYNQKTGGDPIVPYLKTTAIGLFSTKSLIWALP